MRAAQGALSRSGSGSSRPAPEPPLPAYNDDEALRDAIHRSYTSAETDAHRRRRKNVAALGIGLEESERFMSQRAVAAERGTRRSRTRRPAHGGDHELLLLGQQHDEI